jgi:hypothetical protein
VTLLGFHAAAGLGRSVAACWLVIASISFYGWWNPAFRSRARGFNRV